MTRKLGKFERQRIAEILGLRGGSLDRTIDEIETALNAFQDEMGRASEKDIKSRGGKVGRSK